MVHLPCSAVYIGAEYEHKSIANVFKADDVGTRYGIRQCSDGCRADMGRDAPGISVLATRIAAEIGLAVGSNLLRSDVWF